MAITNREALTVLFGPHPVRALEGHGPYNLVDEEFSIRMNRNGRCALAELGEAAGMTVSIFPRSEGMVREAARHPNLSGDREALLDLDRVLSCVAQANDTGRLASPGRIAEFLDGPADVGSTLGRRLKERR